MKNNQLRSQKKIKSDGVTYLSPAILFFSHELVVAYINFIFIFIDFNDTPVSSTHTLPVNIFNLKGEETMLARDNGNFRTPDENRTRDPPNAMKIGRSNH